MSTLAIKPTAHVVDVLGNVIGRDQPILRMEKALEMVSLIGNDIFTDEEVVFFDPFCKAGEILLACAFHRCWAKFKEKPQLLDINMIFREIYQTNCYFGLSPDERHHRLSMRTFLGNTNSHKEEFNCIIRNGNYLSEINGKLDSEKFEKEFLSMIEYIKSKAKNKKIVAVGNPPYQEEDGGAQKSAKPIYQIFAEKLIDCNDIRQFVLVIPSRWFAGGKGLDNFRAKMMEAKNLKDIRHFGKSGDVFPTVDIDGGVCFINWDKSFDGKPTYSSGNVNLSLNLEKYDIIPDDPYAYPILEKIRKKWNGTSVADIAWSRKPFGLATNHFEINESYDSQKTDAVPCVYRNRQIKYIKKGEIRKNEKFIDHWKVCAPKAYGGKKGDRRITLPPHHIFLIEKGKICTETYNVIGSFQTKNEAEKFISFLQTDFSRYLLGLRKITQDIPKDRWAWVPLLDASEEINWDDEKLFDYFEFSKNEREHIKCKIREWT